MGAAGASVAGKHPLQQRPPLAARAVELLEAFVATSGDGRAVCFVGYCLLLLHARARFGDAMFLQSEPQIDGQWLECESCKSKTSSRNPVKQLLPLAGLAGGLTGGSWGELWLGILYTFGVADDLTRVSLGRHGVTEIE